MKIEQVKTLSPLNKLLYWIRERESIRKKKELGYPKPWTDDVILQSYRFCNVRRMDDKVSVWLNERWYSPHWDHPNALLACAVARFVNLPAALDRITAVVYAGKTTDKAVTWNAPLIGNLLREYRDKGNTVFNGAYMVRGNDGMDKIECVLDYYVQPLTKLLGKLRKDSMEEAWKQIVDSYGFGSFMAGQVVADLRWAMKGDWKDCLTWAPIGPGSARGMNKLQGRDKKAVLKQEQFLVELRELYEVVCRNLPHIARRLELHDIQNSLCEYDKYTRVLENDGKPKQGYAGAK